MDTVFVAIWSRCSEESKFYSSLDEEDARRQLSDWESGMSVDDWFDLLKITRVMGNPYFLQTESLEI